MRTLSSHKVNGVNDGLNVFVMDEPGSGGANHQYEITDQPAHCGASSEVRCKVNFQNGPIREAGINGVTHETLTAIVIDRLEGFQRGPFASPDNAEALEHYRMAQECLLRRTRARLARGVEGTHTV